MRLFSIKQAVVTLGAVAVLAVGTGGLPGAAVSTPTAQAAELSQPDAHHRSHGDFHGRRHFARHGFSHANWGWGFHRVYPQYYVTYVYEPVNVCEAYYFDDGVWFCFTGY